MPQINIPEINSPEVIRCRTERLKVIGQCYECGEDIFGHEDFEVDTVDGTGVDKKFHYQCYWGRSKGGVA